MKLYLVGIGLIVFLLIVVKNRADEPQDKTEEEPEKISCEKPIRKIGKSPPSGGIDDITEEMVEIHKKYTDAHGVGEFKADDAMRKVARNWCEVQARANCDLIYPLDVALSAALVPAFFKIENVAQLWYNERSSYDSKKSVSENVQKGYENGYEVIHYANMVAEYPARGLGCCRAPCKDGICYVYACAYSPHGAGYWRLYYDGTQKPIEDENEKKTEKAPLIAKGFEFFSPEGVRSEIIPPPKVDLITKIPRVELATVGCTANVAGNGPTKVVAPWKYPCHIPKHQENGIKKTHTAEEALAALTTEEAKRWRAESEILFSKTPVIVATCDELVSPSEPPFLMYCPASCLSSAIEKHQKLIQSSAVSSQNFRQMYRKESPEETAETLEEKKDEYKVFDVGQSICGQAATRKAVSHNGGLARVTGGGGESFVFDENGVLTSASCSATEYSFLSCGSNRIECLAQVRTPSKTHPWISSTMLTAAKEGKKKHDVSEKYRFIAHTEIGELLFILRDSLCDGAEFSLSITKLEDDFQDQFGIFANYLNPDNFIVLELDISKGIASLLECIQGQCHKRSRYFVGELTGRRLNTQFLTRQGKVTAMINGELVGEIEKTIGPPLGFFGFAVAKDTDLKKIEDVIVKPTIVKTVSEQNINRQNSLLPMWPIEGSQEGEFPLLT